MSKAPGVAAFQGPLETATFVLQSLREVRHDDRLSSLQEASMTALAVVDIIQEVTEGEVNKSLVRLALDCTAVVYIYLLYFEDMIRSRGSVGPAEVALGQRLNGDLLYVRNFTRKMVNRGFVDKRMKRADDERHIDEYRKCIKSWPQKIGYDALLSVELVFESIISERIRQSRIPFPDFPVPTIANYDCDREARTSQDAYIPPDAPLEDFGAPAPVIPTQLLPPIPVVRPDVPIVGNSPPTSPPRSPSTTSSQPLPSSPGPSRRRPKVTIEDADDDDSSEIEVLVPSKVSKKPSKGKKPMRSETSDTIKPSRHSRRRDEGEPALEKKKKKSSDVSSHKRRESPHRTSFTSLEDDFDHLSIHSYSSGYVSNNSLKSSHSRTSSSSRRPKRSPSPSPARPDHHHPHYPGYDHGGYPYGAQYPPAAGPYHPPPGPGVHAFSGYVPPMPMNQGGVSVVNVGSGSIQNNKIVNSFNDNSVRTVNYDKLKASVMERTRKRRAQRGARVSQDESESDSSD